MTGSVRSVCPREKDESVAAAEAAMQAAGISGGGTKRMISRRSFRRCSLIRDA